MPRVIIVAYEGATTLDVTGPAEVFAASSRPAGGAFYEVLLASVRGGPIRTSSTLVVRTRALREVRPGRRDIILVSGGPEGAVMAAMASTALVGWVQRAARIARRTTSVCSGAFVLGAAGLLDGKHVTTHWRGTAELARRFPAAKVDEKAIFVRDGSLWTSAGVTTGIDMALAIVEEDLGRPVADAVAAELVLYLRRPGFQAQFSMQLAAQRSSSDSLRPGVDFLRNNLRKATVESLARSCGLSVRTLHRRCAADLRITPAKLIEKHRIEHARTLLATTAIPLKALSAECGFGSPAHLARVFERELGMTPREFRLLHGAAGAA